MLLVAKRTLPVYSWKGELVCLATTSQATFRVFFKRSGTKDTLPALKIPAKTTKRFFAECTATRREEGVLGR